MFVTSTYFKPTGDGKTTSSNCGAIRDSIHLQLKNGVYLVLSAERGVFGLPNYMSGYTDQVGVTVFGHIYVPPGEKARLLSTDFTIMPAGESKSISAPASEIRRYVYWRKVKHRGAVSQGKQTLQADSVLSGWTSVQIKSSGLVPLDAFVINDDYGQNRFHFYIPIAGQDYENFTVFVPHIAVNEEEIMLRPVQFRRVKQWNAVLTCQ